MCMSGCTSYVAWPSSAPELHTFLKPLAHATCNFQVLCWNLRGSPSADTGGPKFMSSTVTGDESCVYDYDPETEWQSLQWKCLQSLDQRRHVRSGAQSRACWCIYLTFLPLCKYPNGEHLVQMGPKNWALQRDNVPVKRALERCEFLASNNTVVALCLPTEQICLPATSFFPPSIFCIVAVDLF